MKEKNPISWKNGKSVSCKMPLKIHLLGPEIPDSKMSYGNLFIHFEHKFLRNIYSVKQLKQPNHFSMLENYYEI